MTLCSKYWKFIVEILFYFALVWVSPPLKTLCTNLSLDFVERKQEKSIAESQYEAIVTRLDTSVRKMQGKLAE